MRAITNLRRCQALPAILCLAVLDISTGRGTAALERYIGASWTHKDGLPSTLIHAITQTRDGYLWLGTSDGLVRFDGISFVQERLFSNTNLLLGSVSALFAARDGALWVGSRSGVVTRLGATLQKYPLGGEIEAIVQASEGDVWVIARNGLFRFGESPRGALIPAERIDPAHAIRLLGSNEVEASLTSRLSVRAEKSSASYARRVALGGRTLFLNEGKDGTAWLGTKSFSRDPNILAALRDRRGYLWAGSSISGLVSTDDEGRQLETELANDLVESLFEDREGNIWVGTNNGLWRFRFGKIFAITKRDGLSNDKVTSIESTGSTVWVGTQTGLDRIDLDRAGNVRVQRLLRGVEVLTVKAVQGDELWVGSTQGVFTLNVAKPIPQPQRIAGNLSSVTAIEKGSPSFVWLLDSQKGLHLWKSRTLLNVPNQLNAGARTISAIRSQNDGALWIGFLDGGVGVYKEGSFREVFAVAGLPEGAVHDIYVQKSSADGSGVTWFGTDTGLYRFDGREFAVWNSESGLPGNRVLWLRADGDDNLWLGFATGVAKLRRSDLYDLERTQSHKVQYAFYDSGDGLFANPVWLSQAAATLASDGKLWFTTSAGIAVIDSRHIENNSLPPPVVIERVVADNREAPTGSPMYFPPLTKNLQIDYNGLSLVAPRKVRFRYQLEGYDKEWQDAGARRQAFYTNLQPGTYWFHVTASNNDGVWNENGASLNFAILPAFYQTRLFKIICVLAAAAIVWGLYRLRMRQLQVALNNRFKERLAERTRLAQDLHDELLQSAMGVSLQIELIDALIDEPHAAKPHLQRALILSRALLQKGREVLRDLRAKTRVAADIATVLSNAIEEGRQQGGPASRLTVEGQDRNVNPMVADEFIQIGCQAIANALQHAMATKVEVHLIYKPAELFLAVEDDGAGIDPQILEAGRQGHYGLIGMRERAERIGATLTIASRIREGTKISVVVPGKQAYREASDD